MILYRALQPLLQSTFGALAFVLKHTPGLRDSSEKLWKTWDLRYIEGKPAFYSIDRAVFKGQNPIWIHAASGEFEYAKPVIRKIRERSDVPILVTYFSPTYAENVRKFPGVTASCPLPLDSRDELEALFDYLKPSALLISRTDAWPNCVLVANQRGIPVLMFSATFALGSKRLQGFGKSLTREALKHMNQIQCVSHEDVDLLHSELGLSNALATGDTRYDQVLERLAAPKTPALEATMKLLRSFVHPKAFTAGSVWKEDLEPVLQASYATQARTPHSLLLVPHEISQAFISEMRLASLAQGYKPEDIAVFSEIEATPESPRPYRVIIVDKVGLLAELYLLGEVAFVGGSFRKTVHSVMEPLAAGCLTVVGPLHTNNREAIEFQGLRLGPNSPTFVTAVQDGKAFTAALDKIWSELSPPHVGGTTNGDVKKEIRAAVANRGGATKLVLRWLESFELIPGLEAK